MLDSKKKTSIITNISTVDHQFGIWFVKQEYIPNYGGIPYYGGPKKYFDSKSYTLISVVVGTLISVVVATLFLGVPT